MVEIAAMAVWLQWLCRCHGCVAAMLQWLPAWMQWLCDCNGCKVARLEGCKAAMVKWLPMSLQWQCACNGCMAAVVQWLYGCNGQWCNGCNGCMSVMAPNTIIRGLFTHSSTALNNDLASHGLLRKEAVIIQDWDQDPFLSLRPDLPFCVLYPCQRPSLVNAGSSGCLCKMVW